MALSEEDKKETLELMSDAFKLGLQKWRADEEEAAAKLEAEKGTTDTGKKDDKSGGNNGGSRFDVAGFILGRSS